MKYSKIYSRSGISQAQECRVPSKKLALLRLTTKPVAFAYEFRDEAHYGITLENAIDTDHWKHLKDNPKSIFIYSNSNEPTDFKKLANQFKNIIALHNINQKQIYIIISDEVQLYFLQEEFKKIGLPNINTDYFSVSISDIEVPSISNIQPTKRFSIMSRRYVKDRLFLFCELIEHDLLDQFYYSFHNVDPYQHKVLAEVPEIKKSLPLEYQTPKILNWTNNIPYCINNEYDNYTNQYSNKIYNTILQAQFHIIVETIFDEGIYQVDASNIIPWITEKTYKAIACKKIFLCYGMQGSLNVLKQMGFQTFDNIIDETYDTIEDPVLRRAALVKEIMRLSLLTTQETEELIKQAKDITDHNLQIFEKKKTRQLLSDSKWTNKGK